MISLESLKLIDDVLSSQDVVGALGKCEDYADHEGNCKMCTAMAELSNEIADLEDVQENPFEVIERLKHSTVFRAKKTGYTFSVPNKPLDVNFNEQGLSHE